MPRRLALPCEMTRRAAGTIVRHMSSKSALLVENTFELSGFHFGSRTTLYRVPDFRSTCSLKLMSPLPLGCSCRFSFGGSPLPASFSVAGPPRPATRPRIRTVHLKSDAHSSAGCASRPTGGAMPM